jgi:hypothetical protein
MYKTNSKIDYDSVIENLNNMENYWYEERSPYQHIYDEQLTYTANAAADVYNMLNEHDFDYYGYGRKWEIEGDIGKKLCKEDLYSFDVRIVWNTFIAAMPDTFDELTDIDFEFELGDSDSVFQTKKKYKEKLNLLTKESLIAVIQWICGCLKKYYEVKAAWDMMYSVMDELENNSAIIRRGEGDDEVIMAPKESGVDGFDEDDDEDEEGGENLKDKKIINKTEEEDGTDTGF